MKSRSTRWRVIQRIAECRKAKVTPPLRSIHKEKRVNFASKYLKLDFSTVLFTDECRVTLDGPDSFARGWIVKGLDVPVRVRRQQGVAELCSGQEY